MIADYSTDAARTYAEEQHAIVSRAIRIRLARTVTPETARRVAAFSLGTWAQRYPVQGYDLGEDFALFVCDWLAARHVDSEDAMHEALREWDMRRDADSHMPPEWLYPRPLDALKDLAAAMMPVCKAVAMCVRSENRKERRARQARAR